MSEAKNWIKKVYWEDVREQVAAVNPEFAAEVDKLSPGKDLPLYKVAYSFGESILKDGILKLPTESGDLAPLGSDRISDEINNDLAYAPNMPFGLVLKKALQLYIYHNQVPQSWRFMREGHIFALWVMLQPFSTASHAAGSMWQITSGARSLVFLPKISYGRNFDRLRKEFKLTTKEMPEKLIDQWHTFVDLSNKENFGERWQSEALFFSKNWHKKLEDESWQGFKNFLLKSAWEDISYLREQPVFDVVFSKALEAKNMRPNPYLADTVKHLYTIGRSVYPGFVVATDDSVGPISRLQEIFVNVYQLGFAPTMMHFDYQMGINTEKTFYYSLEIPSLSAFLPKSSKMVNKLNDLREIKHIQKLFRDYVLDNPLGLEGTPTYHSIINSNFEYFHSDEDSHLEIQHSKTLSKIDKDINLELNKYSNLPFCYSSPFLTGCLRITQEKK